MKLNQPALSAEGGCAGDETSFVWIDKQNVIIETVKEAEDGDGRRSFVCTSLKMQEQRLTSALKSRLHLLRAVTALKRQRKRFA